MLRADDWGCRTVRGGWRRLLAAACLGCALTASGLGFAQERSADEAERAEQLYRRGSEAFESGRYGEALRALRQAFERYPTYRTACTLGQVELHLEHYSNAARHLDYCARSFPESGSKRVLRRVVDGLADARQHVFALNVRSDVSGARVLIDGQAVGQTPVETDLFVEPGKHVLSVVKPGYRSYRAEVFFPAGGQRQFQVSLEGAQQEAADKRFESTAPAMRNALLLGGGALTVAGVTSGVVLRVLAAEAAHQADETSQWLRNRQQDCSTRASLVCRELRRRHEHSARQYQASNIALLSAMGVALSTVAIVVGLGGGEAGEEDGSHALGISVNAGAGEAQLGVSGVF